jgi:hypothetical protein
MDRDLALPATLTTLRLLHNGFPRSYSPFKYLPSHLVHLQITLQRLGETPCLPGHVELLPATLLTLDYLCITFPPSDLTLLPKGLTVLNFWGGPSWTDSKLCLLLESLPHLRSLKIAVACLSGEFLSSEATKVTYHTLIESAKQGVQAQTKHATIEVSRWQLANSLRLPDSVTSLHLIPPIKARVPTINQDQQLPDISMLVPLPPNLTDLSFAASDLIHLATLGSILPRTMQRICVAAHDFRGGQYHWTTFPRQLKSIKLFHTVSEAVRPQCIEDAIGLPPHLEEFVFIKTILPQAAISHLPKSLTSLDFGDSSNQDPALPRAKLDE